MIRSVAPLRCQPLTTKISPSPEFSRPPFFSGLFFSYGPFAQRPSSPKNGRPKIFFFSFFFSSSPCRQGLSRLWFGHPSSQDYGLTSSNDNSFSSLSSFKLSPLVRHFLERAPPAESFQTSPFDSFFPRRTRIGYGFLSILSCLGPFSDITPIQRVIGACAPQQKPSVHQTRKFFPPVFLSHVPFSRSRYRLSVPFPTRHASARHCDEIPPPPFQPPPDFSTPRVPFFLSSSLPRLLNFRPAFSPLEPLSAKRGPLQFTP